MSIIRVASAQINTTVGDITGNCQLIADAIDEARNIGADIVAFPELAITGYPPEDLLLSQHFVRTNRRALDDLAERCIGIAAVIGIVDFNENDNGNINQIFNAAAIVVNRQIVAIYHKNELPNYGVFDELRYFTPGTTCQIIDINGIPVGVNICEDIWVNPGVGDAQWRRRRKTHPHSQLLPLRDRTNSKPESTLVTNLAKRHHAYTVYTNQVGGQDELVFDGSSIFAGPQGQTLTVATRFESAVTAIDIQLHDEVSADDASRTIPKNIIPTCKNHRTPLQHRRQNPYPRARRDLPR